MAKLSLTIEANEIPIWSQFRWRMKLDRNQENSVEATKKDWPKSNLFLRKLDTCWIPRKCWILVMISVEGIINSPDFDQVTFEIGLESKLLEYPRHLDPRGMCKRRVNGGTTAPSEKLPQLKRRYVYGGYNKPGPGWVSGGYNRLLCVDKVVWTRVKRCEWIPLPKITTIPWMFNDVHDAA